MLRLVVLFALVWQAVAGVAAQVKLDTLPVGTTTYSNVIIVGANATDLYFTHDQGVANVKLKYLSKDLQKRFNYDPKAAAAAEALQLKLDALYQAQTASNMAKAAQVKVPVVRPASSEASICDPLNEKSPVGKPGPKFKIEKWLDQEGTWSNKFAVISFWAPWSVPSRNMITELNALQKKFAEKLAVIGIVPEADAEAALEAEIKPNYPVAVDIAGKVAGAAGITSVPSVLLLDPDGVLLYSGHPAALTEKKLQQLMQKSH